MLFASLALLLAGASSVRAHGYPQTVNIGGQTYQAWHPFADPYASPNPTTVVRKVADDGPITFDSADLTCNKGGSTGNGVTATVAAGQDVTWTMNTWPRDHYGPVTIYMADCGDSCDSFSGSGNVWFKISTEGLIDASKFYWASDKLIDAGNSWTSTIPSNIKAGNYLMRLELLALHSAGAPQLYPSCTQLKVTGGGDGAPTSSELVSIPGVYSASDPALFGNIWNQPTSWPTVGPAVAAFVSGAAAPAPAPAPATSTTAQASSTPAQATSTPAPATSTPAEPTEDPETTGAASSTYVYDPETTPSPTKSSPASTRTIRPATTANAHKTCRVKSKPKQQQRMVKKSVKHSAKREYMRRVFGKMRL